MKLKWYVYIVECSDGSYYTGIALNVWRRVKRHNEGKASKYTRSRLPVKRIWSKVLFGKPAALREEARIKKFTRREKEELVNAQDRS